jgi:hypothetical protein
VGGYPCESHFTTTSRLATCVADLAKVTNWHTMRRVNSRATVMSFAPPSPLQFAYHPIVTCRNEF